jgi:AP-3 complex subunit delta-1
LKISLSVKYLGLLGLNTMMQKEPRIVSEYKDIVLQCLKDEDVSIRLRALDLLNGMVRFCAPNG